MLTLCVTVRAFQGIQVLISVQIQDLVDDTTCREIRKRNSHGNSNAFVGSK